MERMMTKSMLDVMTLKGFTVDLKQDDDSKASSAALQDLPIFLIRQDQSRQNNVASPEKYMFSSQIHKLKHKQNYL